MRQQSGMNAASLAAIAGVHAGTVFKWLSWARNAGEGSLMEKPRGRPVAIGMAGGKMFAQIFETLKGLGTSFNETMSSKTMQDAMGAFGTIVGNGIDNVFKLFDSFGGTVGKIATDLKPVWEDVADVLGTVFDVLGDLVSAAWEAAKALAESLPPAQRPRRELDRAVSRLGGT